MGLQGSGQDDPAKHLCYLVEFFEKPYVKETLYKQEDYIMEG